MKTPLMTHPFEVARRPARRDPLAPRALRRALSELDVACLRVHSGQPSDGAPQARRRATEPAGGPRRRALRCAARASPSISSPSSPRPSRTPESKRLARSQARTSPGPPPTTVAHRSARRSPASSLRTGSRRRRRTSFSTRGFVRTGPVRTDNRSTPRRRRCTPEETTASRQVTSRSRLLAPNQVLRAERQPSNGGLALSQGLHELREECVEPHATDTKARLRERAS